MRCTRLLLSVALAALISGGASAALPACATQAERDAMTVRAYQSSLMVAAVACNQAQAYNGFVTRYQSEISRNGQALKGYFQRVYGGSGEKHLNDFITGLANAWSQIHMKDMGGYCKGTWEQMWQLSRGTAADIGKFKTYAVEQSAAPAVKTTLCDGAITASAAAPKVAAAKPTPAVKK